MIIKRSFKILFCVYMVCLNIVVIPEMGKSLFAQKAQITMDFEYGEKLFQEGLFDLAVIQYQNFLKLYATSPEAQGVQLNLANSYFKLERYDEALNAYMTFILKYPLSKEIELAHYSLGECYEKMGKNEEAVDSYLRVSTLFPQSSWAEKGLFSAGVNLLNNNALERAETVFRLLFEMDVKGELRSRSLFHLARIYENQKKIEKALNTLSLLITHPIHSEDPAEAFFRQGLIYEGLIRWELSEKIYHKSLKITESSNLKQKITIRLGWLSWNKGDLSASEKYFQQAIEQKENIELLQQARMGMGQVQMALNRFQDAIKSYSLVEEWAQNPEQRQTAQYYQAQCFESMGNLLEAKKRYENLVQDSSANINLIQKSLLLLANLTVQLHQYEEGIQYFNQFLNRFPNHLLSDGVLYKKSKILSQNLGFWTEALENLHLIWTDYPNSPLIPQARFLYSQILESAKRNQEALQNYQLIRKQYPGSYWDVASMLRIEHLEKVILPNTNELWNQVIEIIERMNKKEDSLVYLELGRFSLEMLKQPKQALHYFKRQLQENPEDHKDQLLFYMGQAYHQFFILEYDPQYLDSAKTVYKRLIQYFPDTPLSKSATLHLIEWRTEDGKEGQLKELKRLMHDFPNREQYAKLLVRLANVAIEVDSIDLAIQSYRNLVQVDSPSPYRFYALLNLGEIFWKKKEWTRADSFFTQYENQSRENRPTPEICFFRAQMNLKNDQVDQAIGFLEQLEKMYSYSEFADSGLVLLINLYQKTRQFNKAIRFCHKALGEDSLRSWSVKAGLIDSWSSKRKTLLKGLSKSYMGLGDFQNAKKNLILWGRESQTEEYRLFRFQALAQIAEDEGNTELAVNYLNDLLNLTPVDTLYLKVGMIQFREAQYDKALTNFNQALSLAKKQDSRMFIESRIIIALFRQNKITVANTKVASFKKEFQKEVRFRDIFAEIILEQGSAYLQQKEFDSALESFTQIVEKYINSEFVPHAEFEIGHTYLITNKIEKALKILTTMDERYPNHPILARVYLNLGDHYYRSQQFENALESFKRVIKEEYDKELIPLALRYLIKVYDALRMWDAALGLTRDYIERFPQMDDIFQKRIQIGIFTMNLKQYMDAVHYFKRIKNEADFESEAEIQYWIGKCYLNMGQFEQAVFEFLKIKYVSKPTKLPWASTALFEAGQAYLSLNKPKQAIQLWEKVIRSEGATSDLGRIARNKILEIESEAE